jgi:UDP-N-acetylmuramate dehydrogenase
MTAQRLDSLVKEDYPLKDLNTFRLNIKAKCFAGIDSEAALERLLDERPFRGEKFLVLGHGSNILFSTDYDGLALQMQLKGKRVVHEDADKVILEAWGGEDWSDLVRYAVGQGWGGIENLAMVPGTVGAAPIQNLACYGQNLVDVFVSLDAVDLTAGTLSTFTRDECAFSYRDSRFRSPERRKYLVTKVRLSLSKNPVIEASYHSRYDSVEQELRTVKDPPYTIRDAYEAVCKIRSRKLPDLKHVGSAGSFFKNPVVESDRVRDLRKMVPDLQVYPVDQLLYLQRGEPRPVGNDQGRLKVPAGRLLEEMGWKGKRIGNCGLWPNHALVVVNYGDATPEELLAFVEAVREAFFQRYGIRLENEVDVV